MNLDTLLAKRVESWPGREKEGPFSIHVIGLGKAGAGVIRSLIRGPLKNYLKDNRTSFTASASIP